MECNREEGMRVLNDADKKMQAKDFVGAKTFVLKAQKLIPSNKDIPHMLAICQVHSSSGVTSGLEDWYGILQVEATADELSIKKQYRKLALLLHPDKNKFAGAEAAFKLIGEAHRTLTDCSMRSLHDFRTRRGMFWPHSTRHSAPNQQQQQHQNNNMNAGFQNRHHHGNTFVRPTVSEHRQEVGGNSGTKPKEGVQVNDHATEVNTVKLENANLRAFDKKEKASLYQDNHKGKRKKTVSSDKEVSDEEVIVEKANCYKHGNTANHQPRRSTRQKQNVAYNENQTNDKGENETSHASSNSEKETSTIDPPLTSVFKYKDTEFYNFDSERSIDKFQPGQIWSLYEEVAGYPNYYAMVMEVEVEPLKVHVNWLESYPTTEMEKQWSKKEVPIGCGKFKILSGKKNSEIFDTLDTFSHENLIERTGQKNFCYIYPHGGQVWAVYRNWSFAWDTFSSAKIEYDIVEVISKYNSAIDVIPLEKVKGHYTVFRRKKDWDGSLTLTIPLSDILCFSHRIPCFQLTDESDGKLRGYWELDPNSVPAFPCTRQKQNVADNENQTDDEVKNETSHAISNSEKETSTIDPPTSVFKYKDTEFYDFDSERSIDKFHPGQIWSLYEEVAGYPNYYAMVMEVEVEPLKVHVNWLESYPTTEMEKQWSKKEVPIGCGKFKILSGKKNSETFDTLDTFSHENLIERTGQKNFCYIYPHGGQVWAVYRNWSFAWDTFSSAKTEYDIVEVISKYNSAIDVIPLEKVKGHYTVFRRKKDWDGSLTLTIPLSDILCFSHRIPCFQLTDESDGKLRGYWELDPNSVPAFSSGN